MGLKLIGLFFILIIYISFEFIISLEISKIYPFLYDIMSCNDNAKGKETKIYCFSFCIY